MSWSVHRCQWQGTGRTRARGGDVSVGWRRLAGCWLAGWRPDGGAAVDCNAPNALFSIAVRMPESRVDGLVSKGVKRKRKNEERREG